MKTRESSFELLRIIAMAMVVLLHCNFISNGAPDNEELALHPFGSIFRVLAEHVCIVGVNVFVLISGWFGIRPTVKGICSLFYQVVFWGGGVVYIFAHLTGIELPVKSILTYCYFGASLWFVPAYVILYCLAPVLNSYIENADNKKCLTTIGVFFIIEFAYGWLWDVGGFIQGYSAISFIGLYLLSRFVATNKAQLEKINYRKAKAVLMCIGCTILSACLFMIGGERFRTLVYSSPFVVLSSLSLVLLFSEWHWKSKVVNWIASSAFSIYLFHMHPSIFREFKNLVHNHFTMLEPSVFTVFSIVLTLSLFLFCIPFDTLRRYSWKAISSHLFAKE